MVYGSNFEVHLVFKVGQSQMSWSKYSIGYVRNIFGVDSIWSFIRNMLGVNRRFLSNEA